MADTRNTASRSPRLNWKRLAIVGGVAVAIATWTGPMIEAPVRGWLNSCQVLETRAEIDDLESRYERLTGELAYAQSDEGKDVEARRQLGVGPPEDVLIVVRADGVTPDGSTPMSLGDRVRGSVNRVGGACSGAVCKVRDVARYWWGTGPVPATGNASDGETSGDEPAAEEATAG